MPAPLRVLILEDSPSDAELVSYELRRAGYATIINQATTEQEYTDSLVSEWDLILADYSLPQFNALQALRLLQERNLDIPFIVVTGSIEEVAIECMKQGASDYLLKDRLGRLGQAVERALEQKRLRDEKRLAEDALRENQRQLSTLLSNLQGMAYRCLNDPAWTMLFASDGCLNLTGYTAADLVNNRTISYGQLINPDDREMVWNEVQTALEGRRPFQVVYRLRTINNNERWVWAQGQGVFSLKGQLEALEGYASDLTSRFRAEEALRESEELFRQLAENVHEVFWVVDGQAKRVIYVSPAYETVWGRARESLFVNPTSVFETLYGEDIHHARRAIKQLAHGVPINDAFRLVRPDGSLRWVEIRTYPVHNEQGEIYRWVALVEDITERKAAEEALRESAQFNKQIISSASEGIIVYDHDFRYVAWNRFMEDLTGYTAEEVMGRPALEVFPHLHEQGLDKLLEQALAGEIVTSDDIRSHPQRTGLSGWVTNTYAPYRNVHGEIAGVVGIVRDITQRREIEEQLRQHSTRLAALDFASRTLSEQHLNDIAALEQIVTRVAEMLGDACGVVLLTPDSDWLKVAALHHTNPEAKTLLRRSTVALPTSLKWTTDVIQDGQAISISPDPQKLTKILGPSYALYDKSFGIGYALVVPLRAQGQILGVLGMIRNNGRPAYAPEDQTFLQELADRIALAIVNFRLYAENLRRLQYVQALREIDKAIASSMDMQVTLKVVLDKLSTQLKVDAAAVLVYNPHLNSLDYLTGLGFRTRQIQSTHIRLGQDYAGRAALENRDIFLADTHRVLRDLPSSSTFTSLVNSEGIISYYAKPFSSKGQIKGVLELFHRSPMQPDDEWLEFVESLAGQAAIAIENASMFQELKRSNLELMLAYDETIEGWSRALDLRDKETEGHTRRVTKTTEDLARVMGMTEAEITHIRRGALLHDIGKMGVPDGILLKPGPLTAEEWVIMRKHAEYAYEMISPIAYLRPAIDIPYCHHEKWDGSGYPRGLKGEQIPLAARIFTVIDVWDAVTSDRPYRPAWPKEKALEYIKSLSGTQFDPKVVEIFLEALTEQFMLA
jgi:PAS domain S-box-containing protein/putative nucleotidyltransferase with HDIG domain